MATGLPDEFLTLHPGAHSSALSICGDEEAAYLPSAEGSTLPNLNAERLPPLSLTWEETRSLSYSDDTDTPALHPIAAPAADMMADMKGRTCLACPLPRVSCWLLRDPMMGVVNIILGLWHDVPHTIWGK